MSKLFLSFSQTKIVKLTYKNQLLQFEKYKKIYPLLLLMRLYASLMLVEDGKFNLCSQDKDSYVLENILIDSLAINV